MNQLFTFTNLGLLLLLVICCGLLAGSYPAWFVARFNPISSLKGKKDTRFSLNFCTQGIDRFSICGIGIYDLRHHHRIQTNALVP